MAETPKFNILQYQSILVPGGRESKHYRELSNRYGYLQTIFSTGELLESEGTGDPAFDIKVGENRVDHHLRVRLRSLEYRFVQPDANLVTNQEHRKYVPRGRAYRPSVKSTYSLTGELQRLQTFFDALIDEEAGVERKIPTVFKDLFTTNKSAVRPDYTIEKRSEEKGVAVYTQSELTVPLTELGFPDPSGKRVVGLFFEPTLIWNGKTSSKSHGRIFPLLLR